MDYKDLTESQKLLFDSIDNIFMEHTLVSRKEMVTVLGLLINKYKFKKVKQND